MENNTVPATGKRIALITGASSGMGREFVLALNRQEKFDELWLVARRRERLEALQNQVRATVRAIPLDLGLPSSLERLRHCWRRKSLIFAYWLTPAASGVSALLPLCRWMTN